MTDNLHQLSAGGGDSFATPAQVPTNTAAQVDPFNGYENYYSFDQRVKWYFPDRKQWVEIKKLSEGERAKYLQDTRADVHLNQRTGEARIPFDQSKDRKALLLYSITDWHIVMFTASGAQPVAFQPGGHKGGVVAQWIDRADPNVLAAIEKEIRKVNPWLLNEMTVEQIDKEIADLQELRVKVEAREAEERNFASK